MSFLDIFDVEERVGQFWHRMVGNKTSWPHFPEAAVRLDDLRHQLAVFFRGLGGDRGVQIASIAQRTSTHRLSWRQRIGMDDERLSIASRDEVSLSLPEELDHFPEAALNRDLYFWLAAFFAELEPAGEPVDDPLVADLQFLARAQRASGRVIDQFPGLASRHAKLGAALLALRPPRDLSGAEAQVEKLVRSMLGGPAFVGELPATAQHNYRPFLPVPLWGEALHRAPEQRDDEDADEPESGKGAQDESDKRRAAERKKQDNADRKDPLILNRFEKVLAFADMVNVHRGVDEPDEEEAKKAADQMDKITLSKHSKKSSAKLKFDLDLPPGAADTTALTGSCLYPEWDYRVASYHAAHCSVFSSRAPEDGGEDWVPDEPTKRRIRQVKRQFEALRTKAQILRGQVDGHELDTDAVVRARSDLAASGMCSDRVYMQRRPMERDLAVTVLIDASLSTDAWIENRRVLDVEKEALTVFSHGLAACGDPFSILSFTSKKRSWVRVETVKDFDEPFGAPVIRRIGALKPGYYTRIGAAIRHAAKQLEDRPNRHKLLLVITDGKPNDIDHYEGRYGIEDTRKAVLDARAKGMAVFGVTVDKKAQAYFPHLFGRGSFAIVHHLAQLTSALPKIYRHLVG